ncbi:MAG: hypothetical protein IJD86_00035 [Clostridia bacterium]|nr:hypothetical protein [Clostridia bacterium]
MSKKRSIAYLLLIAAALMFAYLLRFVFHHKTDDALFAISMMTLRWLIQVPMTVLWMISIRRRILNPSIRKMLLTVGGLLLFWQVVRVIKYDYIIITESIGRYLWYCFYIPMVFVPLIGVFVVSHIGKGEGYHSPKWMYLLLVPAFFLIAVVFTNDLHQKVFTFNPHFYNYNFDYGYGFMYIAVMAWFVCLALFFVIGLMVKSRVPGSKRFQALPLVIAVLGILFWGSYSAGLIECDLTAVDCIIIIMLLESAIQSGLIPSNMNYRHLFDASTIYAEITDKNFCVRYKTRDADNTPAALLQKALLDPEQMGDYVLHGQQIHAGYVFWKDDIRPVNRLMESISEANDVLSENNELLRAEIALREKRVQADEKTRLYDNIARALSPQLNKVESLIASARNGSMDEKRALSELCVISAYIKRKANLILLSDECASLPTGEMLFSLKESIKNLALMGVDGSADDLVNEETDVNSIQTLYDFFEAVIEAHLGSINKVDVKIEKHDSAIALRMQFSPIDDNFHAVLPDFPHLAVKTNKTKNAFEYIVCAGKGGNLK